jgi:hypothetical protein
VPTVRLLCHPTTHCQALDAVAVTASLGTDGLTLRYRLHGDPARIRLPAPQQPALADGLWRHTCCEAFVAAVDGPEYREFNLSPCARWAAWNFTGYRRRDDSWQAAAAPRITLLHLPDGLRLDAFVPAALLPTARPLRVGLTAVVEASDGGKSYWALAHATAQPDFHLRDSFTLILNPP